MESSKELKQKKVLEARAKALISLWNNEGTKLEQIAYNYADLENDYNYIKELNSYINDKYQFVFQAIPFSEEIKLIIPMLKDLYENEDKLKERIVMLNKFISICEAIHKNNIVAKEPTFEEAMKGTEDEERSGDEFA